MNPTIISMADLAIETGRPAFAVPDFISLSDITVTSNEPEPGTVAYLAIPDLVLVEAAANNHVLNVDGGVWMNRHDKRSAVVLLAHIESLTPLRVTPFHPAGPLGPA